MKNKIPVKNTSSQLLKIIFSNFIGFYALLFLLASCDSPTQETDNFDNLEEGEGILETDASVWNTYKGQIPCADCEGIKMELKLENNINKEEKEFELKETYLGTLDGNRNFMSRGTYEINYGVDNDPMAIVITLLNENGEAIKAFVQEEDQGLQLLSNEGKRIESSHNYRLRKE